MQLVGKGGAVRIQRGKAYITSCRFLNNSASILGGSIMVDADGQLELKDSYFENAKHPTTQMADVLESRGAVTLVCRIYLINFIQHF